MSKLAFPLLKRLSNLQPVFFQEPDYNMLGAESGQGLPKPVAVLIAILFAQL